MDLAVDRNNLGQLGAKKSPSSKTMGYAFVGAISNQAGSNDNSKAESSANINVAWVKADATFNRGFSDLNKSIAEQRKRVISVIEDLGRSAQSASGGMSFGPIFNGRGGGMLKGLMAALGVDLLMNGDKGFVGALGELDPTGTVAAITKGITAVTEGIANVFTGKLKKDVSEAKSDIAAIPDLKDMEGDYMPSDVKSESQKEFDDTLAAFRNATEDLETSANDLRKFLNGQYGSASSSASPSSTSPSGAQASSAIPSGAAGSSGVGSAGVPSVGTGSSGSGRSSPDVSGNSGNAGGSGASRARSSGSSGASEPISNGSPAKGNLKASPTKVTSNIYANIPGGRPYTAGKSLPGEFNANYAANAEELSKGSLQSQGKMVKVTTGSGKSFLMHQDRAEAGLAFVSELEAGGYKVRDIGGYSHRRNVNNPSKWSTHAFGRTLDINPAQNANKGRTTDMPEEVSYLAWKHGFSKGENFRDPMHFETMSKSAWRARLDQLVAMGKISKEEADARFNGTWGKKEVAPTTGTMTVATPEDVKRKQMETLEATKTMNPLLKSKFGKASPDSSFPPAQDLNPAETPLAPSPPQPNTPSGPKPADAGQVKDEATPQNAAKSDVGFSEQAFVGEPF